MRAIEWLIEQLETTVFYTQEAKENAFKQAKEMEKQNIIDAFKRGAINEMNGIEEINSEQYYNEQFKKK